MSVNTLMDMTDGPIRQLTAEDLGIQGSIEKIQSMDGNSDIEGTIQKLEHSISDDNPVLKSVMQLREDGYAGVILFGPPGTSKTYHAHEIAAKLVQNDGRRARFLQFHPSFQYEDFMEGYVPTKDGGFEPKPKAFVELCTYAASLDADELCILVIDEFSRCDVARVFGEALTYLEMSRRGQSFQLPSGAWLSVPENLFILATMNPWDKGVDEIDAALERRFARISLPPDPVALTKMLRENGLSESLVERVEVFFNHIRQHRNPLAHIGHAFFKTVKDADSLNRLWQHQLVFHFERVFRLDAPALAEIQNRWRAVVAPELKDAEPQQQAT